MTAQLGDVALGDLCSPELQRRALDGWSNIGLAGLLEVPEGAAYPPIAVAAFQATFAIITVALVSGGIADRAKFGAWMVFAGVWATVGALPRRRLGLQLHAR
jgi:ammonia channel protein AmtB